VLDVNTSNQLLNGAQDEDDGVIDGEDVLVA